MSQAALAAPLATELLDKLPIPLCLRDPQSRYRWVNQAFEAAFGRPRAQLLQMSDFDLLSHEQALLEQMRDERVFRTGQDVFFEDRSGSTNGLKGTTGWHLAIRDEQRKVRYCLRQWGSVGPAHPGDRGLPASQQPLTAETEQQANLLREERLMVLGQLAGPLAHQLGNPLCSMGLAVANVRRLVGKNACQDTRDALRSAEESVLIADRIIKDLLAYSKIRPPNRRLATLEELVEEARQCAGRVGSRPVEFQVEEATVLVDVGQVAEAMANLLEATCKTLPEGATLLVSSKKMGEFVDLFLADRSSLQRCQQCLEAFEPVVPANDLGVGLGLTTARALVANQGGQLDYLPEGFGREIVFRVRLRTTEPHAPSL